MGFRPSVYCKVLKVDRGDFPQGRSARAKENLKQFCFIHQRTRARPQCNVPPAARLPRVNGGKAGDIAEEGSVVRGDGKLQPTLQDLANTRLEPNVV